MHSTDTDDEVRTAQRYFGSFADDYHRAFQGAGANPLHRIINRVFRRKTFILRTELVEQVLREHGIAGKSVLDLGCGSGEVSLIAARMGARVTGLDIVEDMVQLARADAQAAGLGGQTEFRVANILADALPAADVTMMVGVIEYYTDLETLLAKACGATRELLIIVDTRGPWWRRMLRYALARAKHFYVFYRSPDHVAEIVLRQGFRERQRSLGHSFTMLAFDRRQRDEGHG
jgi:2-polyprenyl-3-methyl-5-hydroxy-6-metoxy-1,4-benzoquinol methylase